MSSCPSTLRRHSFAHCCCTLSHTACANLFVLLPMLHLTILCAIKGIFATTASQELVSNGTVATIVAWQSRITKTPDKFLQRSIHLFLCNLPSNALWHSLWNIWATRIKGPIEVKGLDERLLLLWSLVEWTKGTCRHVFPRSQKGYPLVVSPLGTFI